MRRNRLAGYALPCVKMSIDKHFVNLPNALFKVDVMFVRRSFRNKVNTCFCSQASERASYHFTKIARYKKIKKHVKFGLGPGTDVKLHFGQCLIVI